MVHLNDVGGNESQQYRRKSKQVLGLWKTLITFLSSSLFDFVKKNLVESQKKQSNFSLINLGVVYSYFIFRL